MSLFYFTAGVAYGTLSAKIPKSMNALNGLKGKIFTWMAVFLIWSSFGCALEVHDLALPMNRDKADDTLSKDYMYKVLGDGTIRRTWQLSDKKIFVDFTADSGDVLLIAIEYNKPVAKKVGLKDAKTIAGEKVDKEARWAPPKNEEARKMVQETFGLENPMRMKLKDGAMLFYETDKTKKKIARVSLFASMPATNRWVLSTLTPESQRSAMGLQITADEIAALYKDEQRRMSIPLAAKSPSQSGGTAASGGGRTTVTGGTSSALASSETDSSSSPAHTPQVNRGVTALGLVAGASRDSSSPSKVSAGRTKSVEIQEGGGDSSFEEFLGEPPDWLKSVGIENPEWWHYFALGVAILILLSMVMNSIAASASRARQRAAFEKVMALHAKSGKRRP